MAGKIPTLTVKGERGSWFATVDGTPPSGINKIIPCVHRIKKNGNYYCDPKAIPSDPKWWHFIEAIRLGSQVILTDDGAPESMKEGVLPRKSDIAIFSIDEFEVRADYFRFHFVSRLAHLK